MLRTSDLEAHGDKERVALRGGVVVVHARRLDLLVQVLVDEAVSRVEVDIVGLVEVGVPGDAVANLRHADELGGQPCLANRTKRYHNALDVESRAAAGLIVSDDLKSERRDVHAGVALACAAVDPITPGTARALPPHPTPPHPQRTRDEKRIALVLGEEREEVQQRVEVVDGLRRPRAFSARRADPIRTCCVSLLK